ncbi:TetR/AcrR family transcriptional regulator [Dictyobacter kobayashii]|uniref:TetR family transcriptional regulator n=1 Tax=Dictyobacter kobayashii TaxID=2014872 RepID=A0A402AV75_9CHLR|nr:TetR/AcrR family transcriptional regulator [Dictyobacter kobayashii]GCE23018.1 TetR family transcriptional regulator [Dictyobacter kobayashii]
MNTSHHTNRRFASQTTSTDEQRLRLVQSAYQLLAEKGMAGLRIREVASRIGLNHATLLYYFPTKEALIHAVVAFCVHQFEVIQTPRASSLSTPPNEQLRQRYLSDLAYQLREAPEVFLVLDELLLYARRDPATHRVLSEAVTVWQSSLESLIHQEITAGRFRADLDVRSTALTLMAFCQGIGLLLHTQPTDIDGILAQFAQWFHSLA